MGNNSSSFNLNHQRHSKQYADNCEHYVRLTSNGIYRKLESFIDLTISNDNIPNVSRYIYIKIQVYISLSASLSLTLFNPTNF